jgi:hypothetical protein
MLELVIIGIVILLIASTLVAQRRRVAWPGTLYRLHAGVIHRAEWIAPDEILRIVEEHYLAAQQWSAEALFVGYIKFLREAPRYFSGNYLKRQTKIADAQVKSLRSGVRFVGVLRAKHRIRVRHFSDDGLTCYVVDHQPVRLMVTYEYWQRRELHTQLLEPGAYVYLMRYDRGVKRWKIDDLVQQLPRGWEDKAMSTSMLPLDESLPIASGRDT